MAVTMVIGNRHEVAACSSRRGTTAAATLTSFPKRWVTCTWQRFRLRRVHAFVVTVLVNAGVV
jgi:hypothetical protein